MTIDVPEQPGTEADYDLVRRMRASICVLGPLLARRGHVRVAHARRRRDRLARPRHAHLRPGPDGRRDLRRARLRHRHRPARLRGATIWLDFPSVGATENLLMAAVLAKGTTVIDNAAREPEIVDICAMLSAMGAQHRRRRHLDDCASGRRRSAPGRHRTVGDRIVAGTWAFGAAMTRGDVDRDRASTRAPRGRPGQGGRRRRAGGDPGRRLPGTRWTSRPRAVDVVTLPFPGFATDLLPMAIGLAAVSDGASMITENIFDGRFMFVNEMVRLGADIRTDGHHAVVRGRERLSGAPVRATDIRAGAGLVIAGLVRRRRHRGVRTCTTSTAATRTSWPTCARSARRSSGAPRRRSRSLEI